MKTWVKELLFVTLVLSGVWVGTGMKPVELIGTSAVIFTFCFVQVATRLDEASEKDPNAAYRVHCRKWLTRYLVIKESLWFWYFSVMGAWSALVGVTIFLLYPFWRKYRTPTDKDCSHEGY